MNAKRIGAIAIVLLIPLAAAQDRTDDQGQQRGPRRGGDRGQWQVRMADRLSESLNLNDEQRKAFDDILAKNRESQQDRWAQVRQIRGEIRDAEDAGDAKLADELRAEMRELGDMRSSFTAAFDELEPMLDESQVEQLDQMRERFSQNRQRGGRGGGWMRATSELPDKLELDDSQRKQFREIVDEQRAQIRERFRNRDGQGQGEGRPGRPDFEKMQADFFAAVEEILDDSQKELLTKYRAQMDQRGRDNRGSGEVDAQTVLRVVKRLELSADQKSEVRDIERATLRAQRDIRRSDKEGRTMLVTRLKEQITEVLDKDQVEEFNRQLERQRSPRGRRDRTRGDRAPRGQRQRRGAQKDRPDKP